MKRAAIVLAFVVGCAPIDAGADVAVDRAGRDRLRRRPDGEGHRRLVLPGHDRLDRGRRTTASSSRSSASPTALDSIDPKFDDELGRRARGRASCAARISSSARAQDPIAQADLLLSKIGGTLEPDDLPPVIDVEADRRPVGRRRSPPRCKRGSTTSPPRLGRAPIIYTGFYFWRDSVGDADITTLAAVARAVHDRGVPEHRRRRGPTGRSGSTRRRARSPASRGNVDVDRWNGDLASLTRSSARRRAATARATRRAAAARAARSTRRAAMIDDGDACFAPAARGVRCATSPTRGEDGDLVWTHATDGRRRGELRAVEPRTSTRPARYQVEVYTAGGVRAVEAGELRRRTPAAATHDVVHRSDRGRRLAVARRVRRSPPAATSASTSATTPASRSRTTSSSCSTRVRLTRVDDGTARARARRWRPTIRRATSGCNAGGWLAGALVLLGLRSASALVAASPALRR